MSEDTVKKAKAISEEALNRIGEEKLVPSPENYELWYVYYAGSNPEITRAIEILENKGQKITDQHCLELHQRFLDNAAQSEQVRKAGDEVHKTIEDMSNVVSRVKKTTNEYNTKLTDASGKLTSEIGSEEIQVVLQDLVGGTNKMIEQNQALEEKLVDSAKTMVELKRDLEIVRREALTDSLTNLANRKAFDNEIVRISEEAHSEGRTFSLILMDIDHFKAFNDNFGHQVGDQVLKLVAQSLIDGVKGRDHASRYGGEEFAIILPETNLQGGMKVAEHLRIAVASKDVVNRNTGERLSRITLSGGVAQYAPGEKVEDLIDRADAALYTAKQNGRNQVAAAPMPGEKKAAL